MAKYYIESYKKVEQSFLAMLNSHSHDGDFKQPVGYTEPYEIKLKKVSLFGLIKSTVTKKVSLPKGFNHNKELTKGREWVG
jgi:hypothetical protein